MEASQLCGSPLPLWPATHSVRVGWGKVPLPFAPPRHSPWWECPDGLLLRLLRRRMAFGKLPRTTVRPTYSCKRVPMRSVFGGSPSA